MGSFNSVCLVSNASIQTGDKVALLMCVKSNNINGMVYNTDLAYPVTLPIICRYDDFGRYEDINEYSERNKIAYEFFKKYIKEKTEFTEEQKNIFYKDSLFDFLENENNIDYTKLYENVFLLPIHFNLYEDIIEEYSKDIDKTNYYHTFKSDLYSLTDDSFKEDIYRRKNKFKRPNYLEISDLFRVNGGFTLKYLVKSFFKHSRRDFTEEYLDLFAQGSVDYYFITRALSRLQISYLPNLLGSQNTNIALTIIKSRLIEKNMWQLIKDEEWQTTLSNYCYYLEEGKYSNDEIEGMDVDDLKEMMVRDYKKLSLKELEERLSEYS